MRTTVTIPDPLLRNAKRVAASRGVTLSVVVEDALRAEFAKGNSKPPVPFKLPTFSSKLVQPDMDLDRTSAILVMDDEDAYSRR